MARNPIILAILAMACGGGTDEGFGNLPPPVSTIVFDSLGLVQHTASGAMSWCVNGTAAYIWYGANDPMFISFSTMMILPHGASDGHPIVPRDWTIAPIPNDSAEAALALSTSTPGIPAVYLAYAGTVTLDRRRADGALFGHASYDVQTSGLSVIPVGTVTVDIQARHETQLCPP